MLGTIRNSILSNTKVYTRYKFPSLTIRRSIQLTNKDNQNETSVLLMPKSMAMPTHGSVSASKPVEQKKNSLSEGNDLIKTLSEQLILETTLNLHKPTSAENQVDTMSTYHQLLTKFTPGQSKAIMATMLYLLNEQFYTTYNDKFLRDFEINKQDHLFNSLQSEIQYTITNTRDVEMNQHHLQLMRLKRDLDSIVDEINEMIIDQYEKNCKLDFHEHKNANTLLYKRINLNLNDCSNKITIQIISGIKSEIETLRWQTTRSGLLAVVILASSFLITVNISNKKSRSPVLDVEQLTEEELAILKEEDKKKDIDIII
ncbi:hypothetical protein MOUN0_O09032 [Monosporozyma unispora]|nr:hypothetical protein C6P44_003504 [Kazachstania unispora]